MKKYVFVEEAVQKQTLIWLASQQDRDGCFRNNGKIFTNAWEVRTTRIRLCFLSNFPYRHSTLFATASFLL
jgi:hypothetical protein